MPLRYAIGVVQGEDEAGEVCQRIFGQSTVIVKVLQWDHRIVPFCLLSIVVFVVTAFLRPPGGQGLPAPHQGWQPHMAACPPVLPSWGFLDQMLAYEGTFIASIRGCHVDQPVSARVWPDAVGSKASQDPWGASEHFSISFPFKQAPAFLCRSAKARNSHFTAQRSISFPTNSNLAGGA